MTLRATAGALPYVWLVAREFTTQFARAPVIVSYYYYLNCLY